MNPSKPLLTSASGFHFVRARQGFRTGMLIFLDVVPDKLIYQPGRLPFGKAGILQRWTMANGKPGSAFVADDDCHDDKVVQNITLVAQAFGHAIGAWQFTAVGFGAFLVHIQPPFTRAAECYFFRVAALRRFAASSPYQRGSR
ncbi:MAG: hypothetical protein ABSD20_07185 [Terriglobales bacterium]